MDTRATIDDKHRCDICGGDHTRGEHYAMDNHDADH